MILDSGLAFFYRLTNTAPPGAMPVMEKEETAFYTAFYGELMFETSPARPTEDREEVRTDNRIRVLQNREINNDQRCVIVRGAEQTEYRITRVYHGYDEESRERISDISLEVVTP